MTNKPFGATGTISYEKILAIFGAFAALLSPFVGGLIALGVTKSQIAAAATQVVTNTAEIKSHEKEDDNRQLAIAERLTAIETTTKNTNDKIDKLDKGIERLWAYTSSKREVVSSSTGGI